MPAQASAAPAMAAGQATVAIGKAIESMGETGLRLVERKRKVDEAGKMAAFLTNLDEEASRFSIDLARRSDTENWVEDWKQRTADISERAKALGLSPEAQARMQMELADWNSKRAIQFETQAATKSLGIARAQLTTSLDYHAARGDRDGFERDLKTGMDGGVFNPAEADEARMRFERSAAGVDLQRRIDADPAGVLAELEDPEKFLKANKHATISMVEAARVEAKRALNRSEGEQSDRALDDIAAGKITDPEDIDRLYPSIRPHQREELKAYMGRRMTAEHRAKLAAPEYQQQVFGEVSRLLRDYDPTVGEVDEDLVRMKTMLYDLPDSPMKSELLARMEERQTGKKAAIRTRAQLAQDALDQAAKAGRFGTAPKAENLKTIDLVKQGFLKDADKLKRLGFSEDQAETIIEAARKDPADGQKAFNASWNKRETGSINATEIELATANAIRLGHATIDWEDPASVTASTAAQAEVDRRLGNAKARLAEWMQVNPNPSEADISKKIVELGGEEARKAMRSMTLPARPGRFSFNPDTKLTLPENLQPLETTFKNAGAKHGVDPRLLAAISMHETANGKSSAFRNKNNAMGVSNSSGPIAFEETADSVERMARLLGSSTSGPYKNARTIAEIGAIYAPIGAGNDPGNLNQHWVAGVSKYYRQLGGDPQSIIK